MKCIYCGKESNEVICSDCVKKKNLSDLYSLVVSSINSKTAFSEYCTEFGNSYNFLGNYIDNILSLYPNDDEYYVCRLYKCAKGKEEDTLKHIDSYLEKHKWDEEKSQRLLKMQIEKLMYKDYQKTYEICNKIANMDNLYNDLYKLCGKFYSMMGDYGKAEIILKNVLSSLENNGKCFDGREYTIDKVKEALRLNDVYRNGKPYRPKNPERLAEIKKIHEAKGISYEKKKKTRSGIKESDFEELNIISKYRQNKYVVVKVEYILGFKGVIIPYRLSAIKIEGNKKKEFISYIANFDSKLNQEKVIKSVKDIDANAYLEAPKLKDVMNKFLDFIGELPLIILGVQGKDGDAFIRLLRKAGYKKIENEIIDTLEFAAIVSDKYDLENNDREFLLKYFRLKKNDVNSDLAIYQKLLKEYEE